MIDDVTTYQNETVRMPVPTIDLEAAEKDPSLLLPLDAACRDHGFFLLRNHGMDRAIADMWRASENFFGQTMAEKRHVSRTATMPLGYYDRELTKRQRDLKEVFDYMQPREDGTDRNQWPAGEPEFRKALTRFFDSASTVAARTLHIVYRALAGNHISLKALPEGDPRTSTVRLNYYPSHDILTEVEQTEVAGLGDMALHHHTDPGVLTLLIQDMTGGLQTQSRTGHWLDVTPEAGTIVVNLGDAMQVWTNDVYRAAVHRVQPIDSLGAVGRFSTPYFFNPKRDAVLVPLPELLAAMGGAAPVYRSFTWKEYITGRVEDNYTDLGEDDIQISRFRMPASVAR